MADRGHAKCMAHMKGRFVMFDESLTHNYPHDVVTGNLALLRLEANEFGVSQQCAEQLPRYDSLVCLIGQTPISPVHRS